MRVNINLQTYNIRFIYCHPFDCYALGFITSVMNFIRVKMCAINKYGKNMYKSIQIYKKCKLNKRMAVCKCMSFNRAICFV